MNPEFNAVEAAKQFIFEAKAELPQSAAKQFVINSDDLLRQFATLQDYIMRIDAELHKVKSGKNATTSGEPTGSGEPLNIDWFAPTKQPEISIFCDGVPLITPHNYFGIIGEPGTGKSFAVNNLITAYVLAQKGITAPADDFLGFQFTPGIYNKPLLVVDMERGAEEISYSVSHIRNKGKRYGLSETDYAEHVHYKQILGSEIVTPQDFMDFLSRAACDYGFIIIDGALEMVGDFNNLELSYNAARFIRQLCESMKIGAALTIHANKGNNPEATNEIGQGHAGTYFAKFARAMLSFQLDKKTGISCLRSTGIQGKLSYGGGQSVEVYCKWDKERKDLVVIDAPDKSGVSMYDFMQACEKVLSIEKLGKRALQTELAAILKKRVDTLKAKIEEAIERGFLAVEPGPNNSMLHSFVCHPPAYTANNLSDKQ